MAVELKSHQRQIIIVTTASLAVMMIKQSRLKWFGHVERKDDNDWVKRCITWEVEGIRQRGRQKKT